MKRYPENVFVSVAVGVGLACSFAALFLLIGHLA